MSCRGEGRHAGGGRHSAVPRRAHAARHKASGGPFTRRGAGLCVLRAVRRSIFSRSRLRAQPAHAPCFRRRLARRTGRRSTRIGLRLRRHTGVHGPARARPRHRALKNAPPSSVLPVPASGRQKPRPQRPFGRRGRGCFLSFILRCARFFALRPFSAWYKAGCPGTGYTARRTHCCAWHRRPGSHRWG